MPLSSRQRVPTVPKYICEHGELPTGLEEEIRIPGYGFSYMLYNAFPYIVMGLAMRLVKCFTADPAALLFTARFINVLAGLAMAYVVWLLAGRLFAKEGTRWLFCVAVTYQPMNVFVHSYVNTDSFCMLSTALIVYGLVRMYQEKADVKSCLWTAAGVILCALSYYSAYGYILAAVILYIAYFAKRGEGGRYDMKGLLKYAGLTSGIVLLGIGWWFIRQGMVLDGDFLGLHTRNVLTAQYGRESVKFGSTFAGQGISFFGMIKEMIARRLPSKLAGTLIAAYGGLGLKPQVWYYVLYGLVWLAGAAGYAMYLAGRKTCRENHAAISIGAEELADASSHRLFRLIRSPRFRKSGQPTGLPLGSLTHCTFHVCMVMCMVLPLVLYLRYCYMTDYQEQGRYLLPALVPAMYYVVKGLERLGRKVPLCAGIILVLCAFWQVFAVALPAYL